MTSVDIDNMTTPKSEKKDSFKFIEEKKKEMKDSQYRKKFDALANEIDQNLMNTAITYGEKLYEKSGWGSMVFYNKMANGAYDINVYPNKTNTTGKNSSGVPNSQEPIAFAKIMIAASVLGGKLPDASVVADDKVYARASYELWKRSWSMTGGNGANTLGLTYQNLFSYGWAAWRVYPRRVAVKRNGVEKIMFDDIYREPLDVKRTWLGIGFNHGDCWSWGEVYYERDMPKEDFYRMYPEAKKNKKKLQYCSVSEEAKDENSEKAKTSVTIGYYENYLANRYIVQCGKMNIYDGELPNDGSHGSVVTVRCFVKDMNDPHGVGLYEMMRGNTGMFTYINSLNAQQVEAEISPLIFGSQVQNGTATYRRGPNIVNPKHPGSDIDVVKTSGNVQQGIQYADKQKEAIEENTGVNNIVAGTQSETTLGSTVILKEAAYNRLTPPKNSMVAGLELDAHIANTWMAQLYSVDKIFMIDSDDQLAEFAKQNPDYFVEAQDILDDNGIPVGKVAAASKNLRLNFDFTPEGEVLDNVPTRQISAKGLFDEMKNTGHLSDYIEFIIDPDSMLLPSLEIQKQTFMALFPVITNQITLIYSMRNQDPEAAASQLMALEKLLDIQGGDIYDYISKADYDSILKKQPSEMQQQMQQQQMEQEARNTAMQNMAGGAGAGGEAMPMGQQMAGDGMDPMQPQNPNEVPRPQSPMGSAIDASVGRAGAQG
ncbi:MAG: hypothetical protein D4S01_00095 [Dehalococcoidia bacterium]|nr:MAG: hypothetical protein D4S01_00095 [Dehalococcoidia bacterium]